MEGDDSWLQSNWRPVQTYLRLHAPGWGKQIAGIARGPRGLKGGVHFSLVYEGGEALELKGQGRHPEEVRLYKVGKPESEHTKMRASEGALVVGQSRRRDDRYFDCTFQAPARTHLGVTTESADVVELCLKWCTNITSKNHNHQRIFVRCSLDFVDHVGKRRLCVEADTVPLPWLVKAPPPCDMEMITDGAPGDLVTLVGEPFRKARGLKGGVVPHAQLRHVETGRTVALKDESNSFKKRSASVIVRLPTKIPPGRYEILVTGLSCDFQDPIFKLHIAQGQKLEALPSTPPDDQAMIGHQSPPQSPPPQAMAPPLPPNTGKVASDFAVPRSPLHDSAHNVQAPQAPIPASPNRLLDVPWSPAPGFGSMPGTPWVMAQLMGGTTGVAQVDGGFAAAWNNMPGTPGVQLFGNMPGTPGDLQLGRADSKDSVVSADLNTVVDSFLQNGFEADLDFGC